MSPQIARFLLMLLRGQLTLGGKRLAVSWPDGLPEGMESDAEVERLVEIYAGPPAEVVARGELL